MKENCGEREGADPDPVSVHNSADNKSKSKAQNFPMCCCGSTTRSVSHLRAEEFTKNKEEEKKKKTLWFKRTKQHFLEEEKEERGER